MTADLVSMLAPELTLTVGALVVLLVGASRSQPARASAGLLAFLTILAALALASYAGPQEEPQTAIGLRLTNLTWCVRLIALGIGLIVLLVHAHLPAEARRGTSFSMILFSLAGVLLTALADDLVVLFVALELVSVPTYVLVSAGRDDVRAREGGVKHFLPEALIAALLVCGFSFLYRTCGTTSLTGMGLDVHANYAAVGLLLAFAGIAFKMAAVPFHAHAADLCQRAPSPVGGLLGFFPKLAGFVALVKLLLLTQPAEPSLIGWDIPDSAFFFLWLIAAATMTVGNVLALVQTNAKRILGYASIAHSGTMLVGVLVGPVASGGPLRNGLAAMLFYIVAFGIMNLGAFAALSLIRARNRPVEDLDDLAGLSRQQPMVALAMAVCLFGLMGMPPTAGFLARVYVFSSALAAGRSHPHHVALIALAVLAAVNAVIAAACYLRIIARCYLAEPAEDIQLVPQTTPPQIGLLACCLATLIIGLSPQQLIRMTRQPFYDLQPPPTPVLHTQKPVAGDAPQAACGLAVQHTIAYPPLAASRTPTPTLTRVHLAV